jgi:5-methylthioadenosine/S-adenosylhomocysteine deaminase
LRLSVRLAAAGLCLSTCLCIAGAQQARIALRGTVVTPSGPVDHATVLIEGEKIAAIGTDLVLPAGTKVIETGGIVYPGLIDLHNHVTWNVLSRWSSGVKSGARYDWQQLPEYQMALNVPHEKFVGEGHGCAAERYAEVKAIAGGATSQAGLYPADLTLPGQSTAPTTVQSNCLGGLVRELGVESRLYSEGASEKLRYEVFPLAIDPAHTAALMDGLRDHTINAAMFHIAEGASDNASARREFAMLQGRGLLLPGVSIIHGVALSRENFAVMAKTGVGLIWSPHSNFELYGSTADVAGAKEAGVKMAIAPDWSPTGSDGMLQELKYAAVWNVTQAPAPFTDRDLFEMATRNAAELGGIADQTGTLAVGMRADLLVLEATAGGGDAYTQLVHSSSADVAMVIVDGVAVYGDAKLMQQARGAAATSMIMVCGEPKGIGFASAGTWPATVSELTAALARWGATLSPLTDCH